MSLLMGNDILQNMSLLMENDMIEMENDMIENIVIWMKNEYKWKLMKNNIMKMTDECIWMENDIMIRIGIIIELLENKTRNMIIRNNIGYSWNVK